MSFNRYRRELNDRQKASLLNIKVSSEIRGRRSSPVRLRVLDPTLNTLQAPYRNPPDSASNPQSLLNSASRQTTVTSRTSSNGPDARAKSQTTVRTSRLLWAGALVYMGNQRLPKRIVSGKLEDAGWRARGGGGVRKNNRPTVWQLTSQCSKLGVIEESPHQNPGREMPI